MKTNIKLTIALACQVFVLGVVGTALAMSSSHYRLEWYELQAGPSGASASASISYQVKDSIGTPFVIEMHSSTYSMELGYWPGAGANAYEYLPVILK